MEASTIITIVVGVFSVLGVVVAFFGGRASAIAAAKKDGSTTGAIMARLDAVGAQLNKIDDQFKDERLERKQLNKEFGEKLDKVDRKADKMHERLDTLSGRVYALEHKLKLDSHDQ